MWGKISPESFAREDYRMKAALFIMFFLICTSAQAETIDLEAIKHIESHGNPLAVNTRTQCRGLYQISEICLKEYNQFRHTNYTPQDLFNPLINETIAGWYLHRRLPQLLKRFSIPVNRLNLIVAYNWGIGKAVRWHRRGAILNKLPKETRAYLAQYKRLIKKGPC